MLFRSEVFVGMEFGQSREYSEQSAAAIDTEVKRILDEAHIRAQKLITDHRDRLEAVVAALLERDTLSREQFVALMEGRELPPMTEAEKMKPAQEWEEEESSADQEEATEGDSSLGHQESILSYFNSDANEREVFWEPKE